MNLVFNKKLLGAKLKINALAFMNDPSNKKASIESPWKLI